MVVLTGVATEVQSLYVEAYRSRQVLSDRMFGRIRQILRYTDSLNIHGHPYI